ncbi:hypothetical protein Daura_16780 [Dactylosporangium aurantiacum]|uniref:Leucine rich repeat variant n=1 Tax=Dactylosporangium aurantiacum TaxID=35754 RepID=A0A9Q9MFX1_9ACTN|nr:hypothetical protein [Dactylosporangium aurantiacum]MDG6103160.1 hypothetical protein [Dactylosporangium aurantiacum]UWZ57668.1 hypothetical protein Daura_16780 [Dactylosporangium aurantiacum]
MPDETLLLLAEHPALPAADIDALVVAGDPRLLPVLARRPDLTAAHVDALTGTGDRATFLALVEAGRVPPLAVPRDDPDAMLAGLDRADAPGEWLRLLASWPEPPVRRRLAALAMDRPDVARAVAGDPDCSVAAAAVPWWGCRRTSCGPWPPGRRRACGSRSPRGTTRRPTSSPT